MVSIDRKAKKSLARQKVNVQQYAHLTQHFSQDFRYWLLNIKL